VLVILPDGIPIEDEKEVLLNEKPWPWESGVPVVSFVQEWSSVC